MLPTADKNTHMQAMYEAGNLALNRLKDPATAKNHFQEALQAAQAMDDEQMQADCTQLISALSLEAKDIVPLGNVLSLPASGTTSSSTQPAWPKAPAASHYESLRDQNKTDLKGGTAEKNLSVSLGRLVH